jgi:hypothetical protein
MPFVVPSQSLDNTDDTSNSTTGNINASTAYSGLITFQITGVAGGTVYTAQGTVDGTNWVTVGVVSASSTTMASTFNADGIYRADGSGLRGFRVAVTTAGTGTGVVTFFTTEG